jgi:hypothetical protein
MPGVQKMRRQIHHVLRYSWAWNIVEIVIFVPECVRVAERGAQQTLAERLQGDDMLPASSRRPMARI